LLAWRSRRRCDAEFYGEKAIRRLQTLYPGFDALRLVLGRNVSGASGLSTAVGTWPTWQEGVCATMKTKAFKGFPEEGLRFLEELKQNNNREWFQANKGLYREYVLGPAQDFVLALGEGLQSISEGIAYGNQASGQGSILRIYRDLRFTKDKRPYNTNMRLFFWEGSRKKMENPGYFLRIEPDGGSVYAGMYRFPKPFLEAYREAVVDEALGKELEEALAALRGAGDYEIGGERYKRVPRGYDAAHERVELLLYKGLHAEAPHVEREVLITPELVDVCLAHCRNMAPLHRWLVQAGERYGV
jgi:uncharacterized protein (TIGR02453 family)